MTELTLPLSIIASLFLFVGGLVFFRKGIKMRKISRNKNIDKFLLEHSKEGLRQAGYSEKEVERAYIAVPSKKIEPPKEK